MQKNAEYFFKHIWLCSWGVWVSGAAPSGRPLLRLHILPPASQKESSACVCVCAVDNNLPLAAAGWRRSEGKTERRITSWLLNDLTGENALMMHSPPSALQLDLGAEDRNTQGTEGGEDRRWLVTIRNWNHRIRVVYVYTQILCTHTHTWTTSQKFGQTLSCNFFLSL